MTRLFARRSSGRSVGHLDPEEIKPAVEDYSGLFDGSLEQRKDRYHAVVNHYYNLATDFYEFGWGRSFHFAPRRRGESFNESMLRHEHFLAKQLTVTSGMQVLDVGCGVGGPMANLARRTGANFVGINLNAYQIDRAKHHTRDLQSQCRFIHGDYMDIPEADDQFDAAINIEATPHAPDKTAVFREIFRVLRPGGEFAGYEWCLTDLYDPENADHVRIKQDVMKGNGLPDIAHTSEISSALVAAGFEVVEARDLAPESDPETPWYRPLQGRDLSLASLPRTPIGRALTNMSLRVGEKLRIVPEGAREISSVLNAGADALVEGGEAGVFTPMFYYLARKPEQSEG
ncbi:MAG: methyltransferase domain-containing protein [Chloroflexi bacterium]|nr:methyltransferase domain-containing protein [Chloroflexota bacterium]